MEGGDLRTFLTSNAPKPEQLLVKIASDIATGMLHLALEGIVHRGSNIFSFTHL